MRDNSNNYPNEFETKFETTYENETPDSEFNEEFELDTDNESFDEMEFNNEYSSDSESDSLNEFLENEYDENEYDENEFEHDFNDSREMEFENRLYHALNSNSSNDSEIDLVHNLFREMEKEFFIKKLIKKGKQFSNTKGGKLFKKIAKNTPFGMAVQGLTKVASGDIQGAIKGVLNNDLLKQAISFAPGGSAISKGMDIANKMLQNETEAISKRAVQLTNGSYKHLINNMANMSDVNQLKTMGKDAFKKAVEDMKTHRKGMRLRKIDFKAGSKITIDVGNNSLNIWEPK